MCGEYIERELTYFTPLFENYDANLFALLLLELLQSDCSAKASRTSANNADINFV